MYIQFCCHAIIYHYLLLSKKVVENRGLEPLTLTLQMLCSTYWAKSPLKEWLQAVLSLLYIVSYIPLSNLASVLWWLPHLLSIQILFDWTSYWQYPGFKLHSCGGWEIRTPGTFLYGGFQDHCHKPLGQSSKMPVRGSLPTRLALKFFCSLLKGRTLKLYTLDSQGTKRCFS